MPFEIHLHHHDMHRQTTNLDLYAQKKRKIFVVSKALMILFYLDIGLGEISKNN